MVYIRMISGDLHAKQKPMPSHRDDEDINYYLATPLRRGAITRRINNMPIRPEAEFKNEAAEEEGEERRERGDSPAST